MTLHAPHAPQPVDQPEAPAGTPEAVKQARAAAAAQHNARKVGLCRVMLGDFGIAKVFDAQVQQTSQQVSVGCAFPSVTKQRRVLRVLRVDAGGTSPVRASV